MRDLQVFVPTVPDSVLLPNSRAHYYRRNGAFQEQKAVAALATRQALCGAPVVASAFELDITVHWPRGRKRPDLDNCIAALKSTIDGIAAEIGIDDRHMTAIRVSQRMTNAAGGVDVRVVFIGRDDDKAARRYETV